MCASEMDCHRRSQGLTGRPVCLNLSYMRATLTISLPPMLRRDVSRAAKGRHMTESEFVRDALRRRLALDRFYSLRERAVAQARARGIYTDEDVFKIVS
jgi:Arc/MetJ-type ribon-helix-helix transcriptional regulator